MLLMGLLSPRAAVAGTADSVTVFGQRGDYIGAGQNNLFDTATSFVTMTGTTGHISVHASGGTDPTGAGYNFEFGPPAGGQLQVGDYSPAGDYPLQPAGQGGLFVDGDSRGCNNTAGRFQIRDIASE